MSKEIKLDRFQPREYQLPLFDAIENKGYRRALLIWPRRAGKDIAAFNLAIRTALRRPQVIYYIFPTYSQGRKVIFDSITNAGERILNFIPDEVIHSTHQQELKIRFINGSILQIVGSDNYDALMGTNPQMCIFSEYALQDPRAYQYIRPILTANMGSAIFLSTPRGKNHLWDLYQIASNSNEWFCQKLTVADTQHISMEEIERERALGEMSSDLIEQEYFTSFEMGVEGSYYAKYIDRLRINGQITDVPWEPTFPVYTAWDLGYNDPTVIIFFQLIGQTIRVIDCYENNKQGLEHYAKIVNNKPYTFGKHVGPHDIAVHDLSSGVSRWRTMHDLGIKFMKPSEASIPHLIEDGIEAVRRNLPKMWIDERKCGPLIKALENYRQEYDVKRKIYKDHPLHDWSSHFADCARYLCGALPSLGKGTSPEELERRYREAYYGETNSNANWPSIFKDEVKGY